MEDIQHKVVIDLHSANFVEALEVVVPNEAAADQLLQLVRQHNSLTYSDSGEPKTPPVTFEVYELDVEGAGRWKLKHSC